MALEVTPLTPLFGARVTGLDLRRPLDAGTVRRVMEAFNRHAVLVFPGQDIDDEAQIAFSARFGPLAMSVRAEHERRVTRPEVADISNVGNDGRIVPTDSEKAFYNRGNELWHTDHSFKPIPATASLLSGRVVAPEGGETEFADMRAVWEALPEAFPAATIARLPGAVAEHSLIHSRRTMGYDQFTDRDRETLPPVLQRVVRVHPGSGRAALYLGAHASHFVGWDVEESRALIAALMAFATLPRFVYAHTWTQHDIVMWDNRCTLHRARPYEEARWPRIMHRTTVMGDGPTVPLAEMCPAARAQGEAMLRAAMPGAAAA